MAKLYTMENIVLEILIEYPLARKDDYFLLCMVCEKTRKEILSVPLGVALANHKTLHFPNWETVTRVRRKLQEKHPELVDPETAKKRHKEETEYREYAKE